MSTRTDTPLYVPRDWAPPAARRDAALDLVRGLAMAVLVINHTALESPLRDATRAVLSAAEILVMVSGVVVGMVFGRRWLLHGGRRTTALLLRRARTLYVASVAVVAIVGAATFVPGLDTEALSVSPRVVPPVDTYAYDGPLRAGLAVLTLEAGPWQFNILGFFIAIMAGAPLVLWALARGWWPAVLAASAGLYLLGREWHGDVLPSQSERAFPLLVWQLPFVWGAVLGWHRDRVAALLRPGVVRGVLGLAAVLAAARIAGPHVLGAGAWEDFEAAQFHKGSLDPLRLVAMAAFSAAAYALLRRPAAGALRPVLAPLGCNSFYVFIMHVFICLALASAVPAAGLGAAWNVVLQVACLALLWTMVRWRVLFRWVPR